MNGLSLCAGIGGIDLGLKLVLNNYRTICYVENSSYCQDVLLARMADGFLDRAPIWSDVRLFEGQQWQGLVQIIHGGYPCQPFSVANRRRSTEDKRNLWPSIARIISECKPYYCFFENVAGHLQLGFQEVANDLETMDYEVAAGLFTAAEVGAPHRRQRLYLLARRYTRNDVADTRCKRVNAIQPRRVEWSSGSEKAMLSTSSETLAYPDSARLPQWSEQDMLVQCPSTIGSRWWFAEPNVGRVANGISKRVDRLKTLGNAVVPTVAAKAFVYLYNQLNADQRVIPGMPRPILPSAQ